MTALSPTKQKRCRQCRKLFAPRNSLQIVCGYQCAVALPTEIKIKAESRSRRAALKEGRERLKTRSDYLREAQVAFNAFIRARDLKAGYTCISSDRPLTGKIDAGHYLSVGSHPELRFNEMNCHAQTVHENQWKSGNPVAYRKGLIARYGVGVVEALEGPHPPLKLTVEQIRAITAIYRAKCRELSK